MKPAFAHPAPPARTACEKIGGPGDDDSTEAIADYQRLKASGGVAAPPAAAGRPAPDPTHQAALDHSVRLLVPSYRLEQQQRAAAAAAERQAALPPPTPPRDVLREAHRARADATAEVERRHTAAERARTHLAEVTAARDVAWRDLEAVEAEAETALIAELASGTAGRVVDPVAGEKRVQVAECEHQVEIASRAAVKLASDLAVAQQLLEAAVRAVEAAICAVLLAEAERQAVQILAEVERLDDRRRALDGLSVEISNRQRTGGAARPAWPAQIREALSPQLRAPPRMPSQFSTPDGADLIRRWSTIAAALLADPEAPLAEGES